MAPMGGDAPARRSRALRYLPLLLFLLLVFAVVRPFLVRASDMSPALQLGDLAILIPRPHLLFGPPRRGDLVLLPPHEPAVQSLRRVVALPGEVVEIAAGKLLVEGTPLASERLGQRDFTVQGRPRRFTLRRETLQRGAADAVSFETLTQDSLVAADRPGVKLGPDEYYVLADRRSGVLDSRDYGPVRGDTLRAVHAAVLIPEYRLLVGLR